VSIVAAILAELVTVFIGAGDDALPAAKALADRRWLKRDGKNLICKVTIPEHGRPHSMWSVVCCSKAMPTDPGGTGVGQCPT
jgi:hypothetical protein